MDPGHVDGVTARGRGRGPDRREYGKRDRQHGGLTLSPREVERKLRASAVDHACPAGGGPTYTGPADPEQYTATCEGDAAFNGFYGDGIVNAFAAVTGHR